MSKTIFISGSISIRSLPAAVVKHLDRFIDEGKSLLLGDAGGVDTLVQRYCAARGYTNVTVYTISMSPRTLASPGFGVRTVAVPDGLRKERERQALKDEAMTRDSDASFVIWDGKSRGSHANILRALEQGKGIAIYLVSERRFLSGRVDRSTLERIYRQHAGFSAAEVIDRLREDLKLRFESSRGLYRFLLDRGVVEREGTRYRPASGFAHLFIVRKYRGQPAGIRFKPEFLDWIKDEMKRRPSF